MLGRFFSKIIRYKTVLRDDTAVIEINTDDNNNSNISEKTLGKREKKNGHVSTKISAPTCEKCAFFFMLPI